MYTKMEGFAVFNTTEDWLEQTNVGATDTGEDWRLQARNW